MTKEIPGHDLFSLFIPLFLQEVSSLLKLSRLVRSLFEKKGFFVFVFLRGCCMHDLHIYLDMNICVSVVNLRYVCTQWRIVVAHFTFLTPFEIALDSKTFIFVETI